MEEKFMYLRGIESVSNLEFFKIGINNIYPPKDGKNVAINMYFIASPDNLLEDIQKLKIISQYTIFHPESPNYANFNIISTFEIISKLKSLNEDKLKILIVHHQNDCLKYINNKIINFDYNSNTTIPVNCVLNPESMAQEFAHLLYHKMYPMPHPPF